MFGKKTVDPMEEARMRARTETHQRKCAAMTDTQLIMAMLLEHDAGDTQLLTDDTVLGAEAMKRCGHNPYKRWEA